MKVFIVQPNRQYDSMFLEQGWDIVDAAFQADLVQFTGGSDVTPSFYGQGVHPCTQYNTERDRHEARVYRYCRDNGIPMAGICRGAQFLNVMSGGSLKQHVDGHANGSQHIMIDVSSGEMFSVTSTHHQMMIPGEEAEILAVASESTFYEVYDDGVIRYPSDRGDDLEAVWYNRTQCLCYQPHPEFLDTGDPCQEYYFDLINEFIL